MKRILLCLSALAVGALAQNPAFAPLVSYPGQQAPLAIATADFNGDGILDLAMANAETPSVSVFLGSTGGGFQAPKLYSLSAGCTAAYLTTAKFTGASSPDIAVVCAVGNLLILPANGDGTFGTIKTTNLQEPSFVGNLLLGSVHPAVADFDGDGHLDIAVPTYGTDLVNSTAAWFLLLGKGNGTFQTAKPIHFIGSISYSLAAGDFNGDKLPDLVSVQANIGSNITLQFAAGNGDGTFAPPTSMVVPDAIGSILIPIDINGDGNLDLVVTGSSLLNNFGALTGTVPLGSSAVTTFLGDGKGGFKQVYNATEQTFMSGAALANILGTGHLDLVEALIAENITATTAPVGSIEIRPGKGDGTFGNPIILPVSSTVVPTDIVAADFNGDGKPDIAIASVPAKGINGFPLTTNLSDLLNGILGQFPIGNAGVLLNTTFGPAPPSITSGSVANGATYLAGGLVTGSWGQLKGTNLAAVSNYIWQAADFVGLGNNLPTNLKGTQVLVNGQPAAVYYADSSQINFQVPAGVSGTASIQVVAGGLTSNTVTAAAATNSPGIFPVTLNGVNYAGGSFPDGTLLGDPSVSSAFRKAKPGDEFQLFATGVAPSAAGVVINSNVAISGVTITIGSTTITPDFQGLVGVGLFQINFKVPNLPAGTYPITIAINGVSSPLFINSSAPGPVVFAIQP